MVVELEGVVIDEVALTLGQRTLTRARFLTA